MPLETLPDDILATSLTFLRVSECCILLTTSHNFTTYVSKSFQRVRPRIVTQYHVTPHEVYNMMRRCTKSNQICCYDRSDGCYYDVRFHVTTSDAIRTKMSRAPQFEALVRLCETQHLQSLHLNIPKAYFFKTLDVVVPNPRDIFPNLKVLTVTCKIVRPFLLGILTKWGHVNSLKLVYTGLSIETLSLDQILWLTNLRNVSLEFLNFFDFAQMNAIVDFLTDLSPSVSRISVKFPFHSTNVDHARSVYAQLENISMLKFGNLRKGSESTCCNEMFRFVLTEK